jgi:2-C-methyl-D-erythritol 2,4-cyclodiphosphate synthase
VPNSRGPTGPTTSASTSLTSEQVVDLIRAHTQFKTGIGYDVHRFVEGRPLILGGVEVPHSHGLLGHSDADVVTHAAMDAALGAAGCADIGTYFPDDDPQYKGADSIQLAREVYRVIGQEGFALEGLDIMVVAEAPKMKPHVPAMKEKLAEAFGLRLDQLGLKATTNEKMGWVGRREGIACLASALVRKLPRVEAP